MKTTCSAGQERCAGTCQPGGCTRPAPQPKAPTFEPGDVVVDEEAPDVLGIVTEGGGRGVTVVWAHGGRAGGPGLRHVLRHIEQTVRVPVPAGALGPRGWNREQAVMAALRRAGLVSGGGSR